MDAYEDVDGSSGSNNTSGMCASVGARASRTSHASLRRPNLRLIQVVLLRHTFGRDAKLMRSALSLSQKAGLRTDIPGHYQRIW